MRSKKLQWSVPLLLEMGSYKEWSRGVFPSFPVRRIEIINQTGWTVLVCVLVDEGFFRRNSNVINCSLDADNAGLTCEDVQCPFSEEVTRINLTLLVRNQYRLEEHQRTFFIHDISKS